MGEEGSGEVARVQSGGLGATRGTHEQRTEPTVLTKRFKFFLTISSKGEKIVKGGAKNRSPGDFILQGSPGWVPTAHPFWVGDPLG